MNSVTHEHSPESGWQIFCPRCGYEIKTLKSVAHSESECIAALLAETARMGKILDRNPLMAEGKHMGGSDVCVTCAAHCVTAMDDQREIEELRAERDDWRELQHRAARALKLRIDEVERLKSANEWHSVTAVPPPDHNPSILVTDGAYITEAWYRNGEFITTATGDIFTDVCHWRHIPELSWRPDATGGRSSEDVCDTCGGKGEIDETLGGIATSNPHAPCPDCSVKAGTA